MRLHSLIVMSMSILAMPESLLAQNQEGRDLVLSSRGRSVALVLGNSRYPAAPLRTAIEDARLIGNTLSKQGFAVVEQFDARLPDLEKAIDRFVQDLRRGDTVVIYYAGLCLGIGLENYVVPIDFAPKDAADIKYAAYSLTRLLDRVELTGPTTVVLFLDASRKNPFALLGPVRETPAAMSGGAATHVVTSAPAGKASIDFPESKYGLFAGLLADCLSIPGLTLGGIFTRLQEKVFEASGGLQAPVVSTGADTRVMLARSAPSAAQEAAAAKSFESELIAWEAVKKTPSDTAMRDFLAAYPEGSFSMAASSRMKSDFGGRGHGSESPNSSSIVSPTKASSSKDIEKMARLPKAEVDPTFDFVEADLELLIQTDAMDKRFARDALIIQDPTLNAYVEQVGHSILPTLNPPPRVRWQFNVVRDPIPNAFALPNGSIYLNSGLLAILDNESQLAGILAHEITHVTGRHTLLANRDYRKKALATSLVQMGANYAPGGGLAADITQLSLSVAAAVLPVIFQATINGYSRELERQADLYAIEKLADTGYDPRDLSSAFKKLQEKTEVQLLKVYYTDHPKLEDRIGYVDTAIKAKGIPEAAVYASQAKRYREATRKVRIDNIAWTIQAGNRRTANVLARRLVEAEPDCAECVAALADTYRALGPWPAEIKPQELTEKAKKDALKAKSNLTPQEEEARVLQSPEGQAVWRDNSAKAEELYKKVLTLQPGKCEVHRSLGLLYEKMADMSRARSEFSAFVEACPNHAEVPRIQRKLASADRLQNRTR